jgi:magnesium chelatase accessory protein
MTPAVAARSPYRPHALASERPAELEHRFVQEGPLRWHVTTMGRGPVVLLVHGTGASSHSFFALMRQLAERFTLVAPDLPGHANTRATGSFEPTLPGTARALGRLVTTLGLSPTIVVGHSAGAALAARMTLDRLVEPELVVGLAPALVPFRGLARAVLHPAAGLLSRSIAPALIAAGVARTRRVEDIVRSTGSVLDRQGVESYRRLVARPEHVAGVLAMMARWDLVPLHDALPRLDTPLLLVAGESDRAVPVAQLRAASARLPHATLVVVRGAGHLLHEEQPQHVARLILERVDRAERPREDA